MRVISVSITYPRPSLPYGGLFVQRRLAAAGFQVEAIENGQEMMGLLAYDVDIDEVLLGALDDDSGLTGDPRPGEDQLAIEPVPSGPRSNIDGSRSISSTRRRGHVPQP